MIVWPTRDPLPSLPESFAENKSWIRKLQTIALFWLQLSAKSQVFELRDRSATNMPLGRPTKRHLLLPVSQLVTSNPGEQRHCSEFEMEYIRKLPVDLLVHLIRWYWNSVNWNKLLQCQCPNPTANPFPSPNDTRMLGLMISFKTLQNTLRLWIWQALNQELRSDSTGSSEELVADY